MSKQSLKHSTLTRFSTNITHNKFLWIFFANVYFAFTALLTSLLILIFFGKNGSMLFEVVHLVFESSDWLYGYSKLWLCSLLANSNLSDIVPSTACLLWLILLQVHKEIWNEHEKNHLYQQLEVASGTKHMHCKQIYPRCYKRQREANNMYCGRYCSVLLFDLKHQH